MALDAQGYPLPESLNAISTYDLMTKPLSGLIDLLRDTWWAPDWGFHLDKNDLELHTGGWSGNEDTIQALKANTLFWALCWRRHDVGGHFYFLLKPYPGDSKPPTF